MLTIYKEGKTREKPTFAPEGVASASSQQPFVCNLTPRSLAYR